MDTSSPVINHLLDFLGESPLQAPDPNPTTLLRHGQVAQEWMLKCYLHSWLELIESLVQCDYPEARAHRLMFRAVAGLREDIDPAFDPQRQSVFLHSVTTHLQSTARAVGGYPDERSLQWGIWARDIPLSVVYGFEETSFMDSSTCQDIAPPCMYAAFLVSQVVTDEGAAEEIEETMFEVLPRALVTLLRSLPDAPEA